MAMKNVLVIAGNFKDKFGKYELGVNDKREARNDAIVFTTDMYDYKGKIAMEIISDEEYMYFNSGGNGCLEYGGLKRASTVRQVKDLVTELAAEKKYDLILDFSVMPKFKMTGFKINGLEDNKFMGDSFIKDYSNAIMGLDDQIDLFDRIEYPVKKVRFDNELRVNDGSYDLVVTNKIPSIGIALENVPLDASNYYITKDNEAFVDLTVKDVIEDVLGLFDKKTKFIETSINLNNKEVIFDGIVNEEESLTESIKIDNITAINDKSGIRYITAALEQNDSNDEYSRYVLGTGDIKEDDIVLHNMHIKTGKNKIMRNKQDDSFVLGVSSKLLTKEDEMLDFIEPDLKLSQAIFTLWKLDGNKRISGSNLYQYDASELGDLIEAKFNKEKRLYDLRTIHKDNVIGELKLNIECQNSVMKAVEFELNVIEEGHHIVETILKTFSDITLVSKQEQLSDFLIDKYGFERREDGAATREMM